MKFKNELVAARAAGHGHAIVSDGHGEHGGGELREESSLGCLPRSGQSQQFGATR
jgi:hypothetical protein